MDECNLAAPLPTALPAVCHADAYCNNRDGNHSCLCNTGYLGDGYDSCVDIDECAVGTAQVRGAPLLQAR